MTKNTGFPIFKNEFGNIDEFESFCKSHKPLLDFRYGFDRQFSSMGEVTLNGICPLTLQPTKFFSKANEDGTIEWRNQQECENKITSARRAAGHWAISDSKDGKIGNVLLISASQGLANALEQYSNTVKHLNIKDALVLNQKFDVIIITDDLQNADDIDSVLKSLKGKLARGGQIYFAINFHKDVRKSEKIDLNPGTYWALGWDFLEILVANGFTSPVAALYWAYETGYLGAFNFMFRARV